MGEMCTEMELKRHMYCMNRVVMDRVMQAHVDMNFNMMDRVLKSHGVLNGYFESLKSDPSKVFLIWGKRYAKPSVEGLNIYLGVKQVFYKEWTGVEIKDFHLYSAAREILEAALYRVKTNMD